VARRIRAREQPTARFRATPVVGTFLVLARPEGLVLVVAISVAVAVTLVPTFRRGRLGLAGAAGSTGWGSWGPAPSCSRPSDSPRSCSTARHRVLAGALALGLLGIVLADSTGWTAARPASGRSPPTPRRGSRPRSSCRAT
jgi:hypothetical protein